MYPPPADRLHAVHGRHHRGIHRLRVLQEIDELVPVGGERHLQQQGLGFRIEGLLKAAAGDR